MAKKVTRNAWLYNPPQKEELNCAEEIEELEKFHTADQAPIQASEEFKKNLREKLWKVMKNKYYLFFALSVLFLS